MTFNDPQKTILAIETSCDETGVAVLSKKDNKISILSDRLSSQVNIHKITGGVIPEVAAREHMSIIKPMIIDVLKDSACKSEDLHAIAVTVGPGLMPALSVGVSAAKALSYAWNKPLIPVNHLEGHLYSALLNSDVNESEQFTTDFIVPSSEEIFPALALIVSGGHTLLIKVASHLDYEILGSTRDDAAGEAFDKVARLLNLPYPGGPNLSKLASTGNPEAFDFPRPMLNSGDYDFSFSGLKTAVLYAIRDLGQHKTEEMKADIAASFEHALVESLIIKTKQAIKEIRPKTLLLAGGVAANTVLRQELSQAAKKLKVDFKVAPLCLCGDNAIMIGQVGLIAYEQGRETGWQVIDAIARPQLEGFTNQSFEFVSD